MRLLNEHRECYCFYFDRKAFYFLDFFVPRPVAFLVVRFTYALPSYQEKSKTSMCAMKRKREE